MTATRNPTDMTSLSGSSETADRTERQGAPQRWDTFGQRVLELLNGGALSLMLSIGHRTGLFDTLTGLPPSTSLEIARRAGLNERYVRE